MFKKLWQSVFPPKRQRLEMKLISYREAEDLLKSGWTIAPEEDYNRQIGMVYLELLSAHSATAGQS